MRIPTGRRVRVNVAGASLVAAAGMPAMGQATFLPLGIPSGQTSSTAMAISSDGSTVVGFAGTNRAWWWRSGSGMQQLPGTADQTKGISTTQNGAMVVYTAGQLGGTTRYFTATGTTSALPGGPGTPEFGAVSADGSNFGGAMYVAPTTHRVQAWNQAWGYYTIVQGTEDQGRVTAFSADGSVAVGYAFNATNGWGPAFKWTLNDGFVSLGYLSTQVLQPHSIAYGVTTDGSVIVGYSDTDTGRAAFRWTSGTGMINLGAALSGTTAAYSISNNASIIVGAAAGTAFVWDPVDGVRSLQSVLIAGGAAGLEGWTLRNAFSVSADGTYVVGSGTDPSGSTQAYLARLGTCYPNCDNSSVPPVLNANDFMCFLNRFAAGDSRANCDGSTAAPVLTANDFQCFITAIANGC